MAESFDAVKQFEAVSQNQIKMLARTLGPIQSIVVGLGDVDPSRGAGIISKTSKCLWRKDGRRITFAVLEYGGFITGVSREPDPDAPDPQP